MEGKLSERVLASAFAYTARRAQAAAGAGSGRERCVPVLAEKKFILEHVFRHILFKPVKVDALMCLRSWLSHVDLTIFSLLTVLR